MSCKCKSCGKKNNTLKNRTKAIVPAITKNNNKFNKDLFNKNLRSK